MRRVRLRRSLLVLFGVWFVGLNILFTAVAWNRVFIQRQAGEDPYQAWWAGVVGPFILALAFVLYRYRVRLPGPPALVFLGVSLLGVFLEESTCYLLGAGIFVQPGHPLLLFLGASTGLYLACIGGWVAYRYLRLGWLPALLLFSFASWFLEVFPFQQLYRSVNPWLLYGLFPPVVAGHYLLLALPAYLLVRERVEEHPRWDHPLKWFLALAAPASLPTLLAVLSS